MDGAAGPITRELGKIQHFCHHALAREGGIAMNQNREHFFPLNRVIQEALASSRLAFHDRVHSFKMTWIGCEVNGHGLPTGDLADRFESEVILHISIARHHVRHVVLRELVKQNFQGLAKEIGQDAQTSTMRHAHDNFLSAMRRQIMKDRLERDEQGFSTFHGETLLPNVAAVKELLKSLRLQKPAKGILRLDNRS